MGKKRLPYKMWKLRVETIDRREGEPDYIPGSGFTCRHTLGESFRVEGEMIHFDKCKCVSQYILATLLPHFPVRQRPLQDNDWASLDAVIACPDPHCSAGFKIIRYGEHTEYASTTSGVEQAKMQGEKPSRPTG